MLILYFALVNQSEFQMFAILSTNITDMIVNKIFNRRKRNIDKSYKNNELNVQSFHDKDYSNYEYDNLKYNRGIGITRREV